MSAMIRLSGLTLAMAATLCGASSALAQVIEIDSGGAARTFDGPTLFTATDAVSLRPKPMSSSSLASAPGETIALIEEAARVHQLDPALLKAVAWQESRGRMSAVSNKGARGVMQLMPATAIELGVDPHNMSDNIRGGALYLRRQIDRFGSVPLGLAAYNAGPGAVMRFGGIPPFRETRDYVSRIMSRWRPVVLPTSFKSIIVEVVK